ncbi:MAG: gliding motility lipoprotein GldH [Flavobacteriaceae bacterium]|nr:gliding motility lipoprotein GldH [Flavobacteriaceae bacterium]
MKTPRMKQYIKSTLLLKCGVLLLVLTGLTQSCSVPDGLVTEDFKAIENGSWNWKDGKKFTFTIDDTTCFYAISTGLRITGKYAYSNIWMIYTIECTGWNQKEQFSIEIADQTGSWLGVGMSNLIAYEKPIIPKIKLKAGVYQITIVQNMREESLLGIQDVGVKIEKGPLIL